MNKLLQSAIVTLVSILSLLISPFGFASDAIPKFDCTLTDNLVADGKPGDAKDTFSKATPKVYLICETGDVEKADVIKSEWIAADTHNVAPANYKIDEKSVTVPNNFSSDDTYTASFSLSSPTKGWPVGSYHVDVYVGDQLVKSVPFSVK